MATVSQSSNQTDFTFSYFGQRLSNIIERKTAKHCNNFKVYKKSSKVVAKRNTLKNLDFQLLLSRPATIHQHY